MRKFVYQGEAKQQKIFTACLKEVLENLEQNNIGYNIEREYLSLRF